MRRKVPSETWVRNHAPLRAPDPSGRLGATGNRSSITHHENFEAGNDLHAHLVFEVNTYNAVVP